METERRADASGPSTRLIAGWTAAMLAALGLAAFTGAVVIPTLRTGAVLDRVYHGQLDPAGAVRELGGERQAQRLLGAYLRAPECLARRKTEAASLMCSCGPGAADALARALHGHLDERWALEARVLSSIARDSYCNLPEGCPDGWEPLREALGATSPLSPVSR